MADAKISALTALAGSAIATDDELVIVDTSATATKKTDIADIVTYLRTRLPQYNAAVANQTIGASDTYVTNSNVSAANAQAKTIVTWNLVITKSTAGTGTPVFTVRLGSAGTTSDTARLTFTWPAAQTAVADEMHVTITVTFRTTGSGTTAVIEGEMCAVHELTTTGFGGTGLGSVIIVNATSSGFDSTTANTNLGLSINGSTSASWTLRQCQVVLSNPV